MTQRYDTYKDSGVQWLGEIPGHWERTRLKNVMKLLNGRAYLQPELQEIGKYRILRVGNFFTNDRWYYSDMELEPNKYCNKGDLLFAWSASFGPYIWNEEKAIYHYHIWKVLLGERYDKLYAYYMFWAFSEVKRRDVHGSTMVHLTLQNMNQSYIPVPPLSEQRSIVSYLDAKCGKIDEWVTKKRKEVEHLQELKQRVIADAVTRGLNPHVKMKATNIPWLKEIPEHWEMSKISSHFRQRNEKVSDKDYPALSVSKQGVTPQLDNVALSNAEGTSRKLVKVGDYAVNSRSDRKGSCGVSKYEGSVSLITIVLEPFNINGEYIHYLFRSNLWVEEFYRNGRGIVADLWTTNYQMMKSMYMPVPPLSEQKQIVSYLDTKTSQIDKLIAHITKEIECIKEYKQRLISDVVTGQIKVC